MRRYIAYIRLASLIVLCLLFQPALSRVVDTSLMPLNGYSQNTRLDLGSETALNYRYQERDWSMPRYADSLSFGRRLYVNFGYGFSRDWDDLKSSGEQSFQFGMGYNFSPVHSVELDGNVGGSSQSILTTYYMNLNNAALRRDAHSRFDVLMGAGVDVRFVESDVEVGFATSLRGRYNITRNLGLYVEPRVIFSSPMRNPLEGTRAITSFNVGLSYRFGSPEFYFLDYLLPNALRNPKRLNVPYDYDVVPFFAIKSNVLLDMATALNVAVEVPIGDRWSVGGEWLFPWWLSEDNSAAIQVLSASLEGRYWFGDREKKLKMTGLFAGYYLGGGLYDVRYDSKGYQGEFYIASGLTGGYSHPIVSGGALRMEYAVSFGYLSTDYRYYEGRADNRFMVWQYNGRYTWFGPTKASVSLVWMLNLNKKRKGGGL